MAHRNQNRTGSNDFLTRRKTIVPGRGERIDRRSCLKLAGAAVAAPFLAGRVRAGSGPHTLEVVTTETPSELSYEFTATGEITKLLDNGRNSAERNNDSVTDNGDGTWTATGYTGNGYGDAYTFEGEVISFTPTTGPFELRLDGSPVAVDELAGSFDHRIEVVTTESPSELSYEFTATGRIAKFLDNGRNSAERNNDGVTDNGDGTWTATGYTGNGYGDAFYFDGEITDFSPLTGPFELRLDGSPTTAYELTGTEPPKQPDEVIGGGDGYENTVPESDATVVVSTLAELERALGSASRGDVVYVAGDAKIDVGSNQLAIPPGVTLASDRGIDGAGGGRITTGRELWPVFEVGKKARVTGLRIDGPNYEFEPYGKPISIGLDVTGSGVEIDNCELWGFSHAAVRATADTHVHHSHVHHNPMDGLGYGVLCKGGHPTIEYNRMNYNRHSVASNGSGGYTVQYNHFGSKTFGHVIDCHRPGGTTLDVHHNTIEAAEHAEEGGLVPGVAIRGVPEHAARIGHNWFYNPEQPRSSPDGWTDEAIIQVHTSKWRNVSFENNAYGSDEPAADVGCPR